MPKHKIEAPYYPIVYVRGYAMTPAEREETFHDTYYGFAATSVEKRQARPPEYFEADVFEGQFIRFMKLDRYYADAANRGVERFHDNPSRSIWICRFYDQDYFQERIRPIEDHADDLYRLIFERMPEELKVAGVALGKDLKEYKVILMAHSMGGLVCRTLIQNLMPKKGRDPKEWIHRFVTVGTPHGGIELGRVPNLFEDFLTKHLNPFDAGMFKEERMRDYLRLKAKTGKAWKYDINSVAEHYPIKRCLNIIGSDYGSYGKVQHVTGGFSDGLVKQDRAYMVAGPKPKGKKEYPDERRAYWANVHRAHSGYRGIVNSYESFENIQRFLFGNIIAQVWLEDIEVNTEKEKGVTSFFDFEFLLSIRGTAVYLHRREQDPCENAHRVETVPDRLLLHTTFMNSGIKTAEQKEVPFSHFSVKLRVVEHRRRDRFLWDREYPGREIYADSLEIRVGDSDPDDPGEEVWYRSFGGVGDWTEADRLDADPTDPVARKVFEIPLEGNGAFRGRLVIRAGAWPDPELLEE